MKTFDIKTGEFACPKLGSKGKEIVLNKDDSDFDSRFQIIDNKVLRDKNSKEIACFDLIDFKVSSMKKVSWEK